jgi:hypothetical protein
VGDAPTGGHQVELAGPDELFGAEAVAVQHLALQQPGDRLQADVGWGGTRMPACAVMSRGP